MKRPRMISIYVPGTPAWFIHQTIYMVELSHSSWDTFWYSWVERRAATRQRRDCSSSSLESTTRPPPSSSSSSSSSELSLSECSESVKPSPPPPECPCSLRSALYKKIYYLQTIPILINWYVDQKLELKTKI